MRRCYPGRPFPTLPHGAPVRRSYTWGMASDDRHTLKRHFQEQFDYDLWANHRVIDAIEDLPDGEARAECFRLASHLLRASTRWLERILDQEASSIDRVDDAPALRERARANADAWAALLEARTAPDFPKDVTYRSTDGSEHHNELRAILAHVLNHGTHHRGQVVRHIRLAGLTPPTTDLIDFDRERRAAEDEG